jgi:hypothetical protein
VVFNLLDHLVNQLRAALLQVVLKVLGADLLLDDFHDLSIKDLELLHWVSVGLLDVVLDLL